MIRTRGHNPKPVRRDIEPARFHSLWRNRFSGMGLGLWAIGFGVLWLFLGLWALIPAVIVGVVLTARAQRRPASSVAGEFT